MESNSSISLVTTGIETGAPPFCVPARSAAEVRPCQKRQMGRWSRPTGVHPANTGLIVMAGRLPRNFGVSARLQ